ncbi:MAG: transglycosylase domain-containing protein, partial [Candidatus Adiutrix sp.]|nr:transglycosylase domain-containing protein [Candidatus Adiutrix sp.]
MNDKKNTPPDYALDLDVAGPAAWDDEMESFGRATKKPDLKSAGGGDKNKTAARTRIRRSAAPKSGGGLRGLIAGLFWLAASLGLAGLVAAFGLYAYFSQDLPSTAWLKNHELPTITYIYSDDGRVVGEYSHERRIIKSLNEIPPMVVNAFLAVEDAKFYQHHGVNFKAIIRAAYVNFTQGDLSQGASTITQQVVRGLILTPEKTVSRKIREAILAFRIEGNLSKEEIIGLYLNLIYLGRGAYGVEAAARTYFDKGVEHLTVAEAALLAGIAHSPEGKNPLTKPQEARERQRHSIGRMKELGYITTEEAEAALNEVLSINGSWPNPNTTVAPYFTEHVRRILEEKYGADSLYNDGWKIYATVNIEAQKAADAAVARGLWEYARRRGFKGPVTHMELEEQIAAFISEEEKKLPAGGLKPDRLYQAVVMEVDDKNAALAVRVGPYHGHIAKNNLSWALKGSIKGRFSRGDVVWVRLLEEAAPKKDEAAEAGGDSRDLSAVLAQNAGLAERLEMSLEQRTDLQAALLSMDALNGDVKAMVGGRDFSESQFNRATQSQRQPGSSFKPIVYAAAMDNGFTP